MRTKGSPNKRGVCGSQQTPRETADVKHCYARILRSSCPTSWLTSTDSRISWLIFWQA